MGKEIFNLKRRRDHRVFLGEEKERLCLPKPELGKERVRMERGFSRIGRICTDLIFRGRERAIMPSQAGAWEGEKRECLPKLELGKENDIKTLEIRMPSQAGAWEGVI